MTKISRIEFLVNPVWHGEVDERKKNLWLRRIKRTESKEDTLFVMGRSGAFTHPVENELIKAGEGLGSRFIESDQISAVVDAVGRHPLSQNVDVIAFGHHGGACAIEDSKAFVFLLGLKHPEVNFTIKEDIRLCITNDGGRLSSIIYKRNPELHSKCSLTLFPKLAEGLNFDGETLKRIKEVSREATSEREFIEGMKRARRKIRN